MNLIFIDDESLVLANTLKTAQKIDNITYKGFNDPFKALNYTENNNVDIAFVDILLGCENGIDIAKKLKNIKNDLGVVFLTSHSEFALQAFDIKAQGYIVKPVSKEDLEKEINYAKKGILPKTEKKAKVMTFGNFDIFINGKSVKFKRSKTKELFAYLIDRKGASVSIQEAIAVLWEDVPLNKTMRSMIHNLISDMNTTLKAYDCGDMIIKDWNSLAVDSTKISCDYYDFLSGNKKAINEFCGEYMSNYSWGEFTLSSLEQKEMRFLY